MIACWQRRECIISFILESWNRSKFYLSCFRCLVLDCENVNLSKKGWSLIWTQQQKLNYWRKGFRSWLPVKRKITGCAERLEGISGNCKKNWKFVLKADFSGRQGCCRYLNIHGCIKGVCNISEQKSSDIVWHPKLSCVVGVL